MHPIMLTRLASSAGAPDQSQTDRPDAAKRSRAEGDKDGARDFGTVLRDEATDALPPAAAEPAPKTTAQGTADDDAEALAKPPRTAGEIMPADKAAEAKLADRLTKEGSADSMVGKRTSRNDTPETQAPLPRHKSQPSAVATMQAVRAGEVPPPVNADRPGIGTAVQTETLFTANSPVKTALPSVPQSATKAVAKAVNAAPVDTSPNPKTSEVAAQTTRSPENLKPGQPDLSKGAAQAIPETDTTLTKDTVLRAEPTMKQQPIAQTVLPSGAPEPSKAVQSGEKATTDPQAPAISKLPADETRTATIAPAKAETAQPAFAAAVSTVAPAERRREMPSRLGPQNTGAMAVEIKQAVTKVAPVNGLAKMVELSKAAEKQALLVTPAVSAEAEPSMVQRFETGPSTQTTQQVLQSMPTRLDLPNHVSRQVAEALQHMPGKPVEISLNPEELGRVRLGVTTSEAGIVVSVLAERQETIDLMRRHINALETAFQAIGYSDISFSFAGNDTPDGDQGQQQDGRASGLLSDTIAPDDTPATLTISTLPTTGLDLRL